MSHAFHRTPSQPARPATTQRHAAHHDDVASLALVLGSAMACSSAADASAIEAQLDEPFEDAVALYIARQWGDAFNALAGLADRGHLRAAKLALLMSRYRASLYGSAFEPQPAQVARWAQRVLGATAAAADGATPCPTSRATASPSSITASA